MSTVQQEQDEELVVGEDPPIELNNALTNDPVMLLDIVIDALKLAREAAQRPKEKYHTVVVPDGAEATLSTVDSFDEFLAVWREAYRNPGQLFGFYKGEVVLPSRSGDCMVASWGVYPLFTKVADTEVDPKGYTGQTPLITKATPAPVAAEPVNEVDDDVDENEDGDVDDDEELEDEDD